MANNDNKFVFTSTAYTYAVTVENDELLILNDVNDGNGFVLTDGCGRVSLKDENNNFLATVSGIKFFEEKENGLTVYYDLTGNASDCAEIVADYTFLDGSLKVLQHIRFQSNEYTASVKRSFIERNVFREYTSDDARMVGKWVYPKDGDFPYQLCESVGTVMKFENGGALYTFLRVPEDAGLFPPTYPKQNIPLRFENGADIDLTVEYTLVPTYVQSGIYEAYLPLFKGKCSDFAAGVFPVTENTEKSTVFVGNRVELYLNVTNIVPRKIEYTVCYSLYNYYGELVASDSATNVSLDANESVNRLICAEDKYGMYYLNFTVKTENYSYTECYPFALIPTSEYKYRITNPFGISSIADNGVEEDADIAGKLNVKIGTGNFRFIGNAKGPNLRSMTEYMHKNGIQINVQLNMNSIKPWGFKTAEELVNAMNEYLPGFKGLTDSIEVGNEINFSYSEGKEDDPEAYAEKYINKMYLPSVEAVRSAGFKYANAGISGCGPDWFDDVLGKTKKLWGKTDILSVHPYGHPCMPDINGRGELNGKWNYEAALQRTVAALKKHGEKEWYVSETGDTTPPADRMQIDLRTQADYEMRILILGHAYGASRIQLYCFYDRSTANNGYSAEDYEQNYGIFYQPDFLGIVKPKPAAAAFATINYVTDGIVKTEEFLKYARDDGTLRVFKLTLNSGKELFAVWSNTHPLSNGIFGFQTERTPEMPWIDKWHEKYENVTFETCGETVDVTDIMGNKSSYTAENGKVTLPIAGSVLYIDGIK